MCLHDRHDLNKYLEDIKDEKRQSIVWFELGGRVYGAPCIATNSENVKSVVRDLQRWHSNLKDLKPYLSDVNRKRLRANLKPITDISRKKKAYKPVEGFEASGLTYRELITQLNSYSERRLAAA